MSDAEFINYVRKHGDHVANGLPLLSKPELLPEYAEQLETNAQELSVVAGVSVDVATSAIVEYAILQQYKIEKEIAPSLFTRIKTAVMGTAER